MIIRAYITPEVVEKTEQVTQSREVVSAIKSYARNFTNMHAIANYDKFCYADTDSIHLQGLEPAEMDVEKNKKC